jgi:hypothetical protein
MHRSCYTHVKLNSRSQRQLMPVPHTKAVSGLKHIVYDGVVLDGPDATGVAQPVGGQRFEDVGECCA